MNVDRRGSREGKKTSLRQTDKAKKHATYVTWGAPLMRTTPITPLAKQVHAESFVDAGCNLVNRQFENDFQRIVLRGIKSGVEGMVILPNDFAKVANAITLCKWQPGVLYTAAGLHPNNIEAKQTQSEKQVLQTLFQLREQLVAPEVVALFCGLDYARDMGLKAPQEKLLEAQLKLAVVISLTNIWIILLSHTGSSAEFDHLISVIQNCRNDFKYGMVHNFYGSEQQLQKLLDLNLHISVSGAITDPKYNLKDYLDKIPLEKLLICSDSPYFTPKNITDEHIRDSKNEPSNLTSVLQACAQILKITTKQLAETVRKNSVEFYALYKVEASAASSEQPKAEKAAEAPQQEKESDKSTKAPTKDSKAGDKQKQSKPTKAALEKIVESESDSDEEPPTKGKSKSKKGKKGAKNNKDRDAKESKVEKAAKPQKQQPEKQPKAEVQQPTEAKNKPAPAVQPKEEKKEEAKESSSEEDTPDVGELSLDEYDSDGQLQDLEFACKMCRTKLFNTDNLLDHSKQINALGKHCRMYFITKLDWMKFEQGEEKEGRLLCPKCTTKLGRFDANGIQCSCGELVGEYKVVRSRVDVVGAEGKVVDSDSDEGNMLGEQKKKAKKKSTVVKKSTKGNFTSFRNKTT